MPPINHYDMKTLYFTLLALCVCFTSSFSQGLQGLFIEQYYHASEDDKAVDEDGGDLPADAVTYRVYLDLAQGYEFQAVYAETFNMIPENEVRIATSTTFFNNEDRGDRTPSYRSSQADGNTVMLDSWLSVGNSMRDFVGVPKYLDEDGETIENSDGVLQNVTDCDSFALSERDGQVAGVADEVTLVGFSDTDLSVLDDGNDQEAPVTISSFDGSWASLNGVTGPDTNNFILLGQFTTDGVFEVALNVQIRQEGGGPETVERYVWDNPGDNEILFTGLALIDSSCLSVSTSTEEFVDLSNELDVFPNPASEQITISLSDVEDYASEKVYTLRSVTGAVMRSGEITGDMIRVDVADLTPGMYLLTVELDNKYYTDKVMVTR